MKKNLKWLKMLFNSWNSIFWTWNFSFNSYIYYLNWGFIASTCTFHSPTYRTFNLLTCDFSPVIHAFSLLIRAFDTVTRGFELTPQRFELVTCVFKLAPGGFELLIWITRSYIWILISCFTFPPKSPTVTNFWYF